MKKKTMILGAAALLCLSGLTPFALHATNGISHFVQGESKDYSLAITPATLKINESGNKGTIRTSLSNELFRTKPITFASNMEDSFLTTLSLLRVFLVSKPSPRR